MAFGAKKAAAGVSSSRLAAVAGIPVEHTFSESRSSEPAQAKPHRGEIQPDMSRMRPRGIEETPEARKRRLAAKTINFSATIIARIVILGAAAFFLWNEYQFGGEIHRGVAVGVFAMVADLGRVILKASEPGTK